MNKGRNIAILMLCLFCVSVLGFFMLTNRDNNSAVVDRVRYVYEGDQDGYKQYTFYFVGEGKMKANLIYDEDAREYRVNIFTQEETEYPYTYLLTGQDRSHASVTAELSDPEGQADLSQAYSLYTKKFFISMVFGRPPLLVFWEALIVAVVGATGGLIYGHAEELWNRFQRPKEDRDPVWEDFARYRYMGLGVIAAAVCLLLIFLFV